MPYEEEEDTCHMEGHPRVDLPQLHMRRRIHVSYEEEDTCVI
jgi:hypothetical protein